MNAKVNLVNAKKESQVSNGKPSDCQVNAKKESQTIAKWTPRRKAKWLPSEHQSERSEHQVNAKKESQAIAKWTPKWT